MRCIKTREIDFFRGISNIFGAVRRKTWISLLYCIRENWLLFSECYSRFIKSRAKDGRVTFVTGFDRMWSRSCVTTPRIPAILPLRDSALEAPYTGICSWKPSGTCTQIYIYTEAVVTPMYTPVHILCLCYPASLIDYARVFQGLTDETREDLWDDTRKMVAR